MKYENKYKIEINESNVIIQVNEISLDELLKLLNHYHLYGYRQITVGKNNDIHICKPNKQVSNEN